jgi:hypothetical protein
MSKYKIGDRVKCKGEDGNELDVGTVYSIVNDNSAWVVWDSMGSPGWFWFDEASVSLVEPEQNKDVQIIDGIEYPYLTVEEGYPVRILCNNLKDEDYPIIFAELKDGFEVIQTLTQNFNILPSFVEPYIKPYAKPKSIFEGVKPGTVVFVKPLADDDEWRSIIFQSETEGRVECTHTYWEKINYQFRLDNPYLED